IRQGFHKAVFERLIPKLLWLSGIGLFAAIVLSVGSFFKLFSVDLGFTVGVSTGLGSFGVLASWIWSFWQVDTKPREGKFESYVRHPNYQNQRGFLTDVQEDVARVFDLLVDEQDPAIVFIDDLDRCSPLRVAAIMEALNNFVGGPLKAYFVIG